MTQTMSRLMRRQGLAATGLNQVVAESEAPKGSIYFHFPGGKEELAAEAIKASGESIRRLIDTTLKAADSPEAAIQRLATGLAAVLAASGYEDGCPIATVALEASATSDYICRSSSDAFRSWERAISDRLTEFGWRAEEADSAASFVLSALEGALILSRAYKDTGPLLTVGEQFAARFAAQNP